MVASWGSPNLHCGAMLWVPGLNQVPQKTITTNLITHLELSSFSVSQLEHDVARQNGKVVAINGAP